MVDIEHVIVSLLHLLQKIDTMHHVHTTYRLNLRNESIPGNLYVLGGFVTGTLNVLFVSLSLAHRSTWILQSTLWRLANIMATI